jgi:hypothetical protein
VPLEHVHRRWTHRERAGRLRKPAEGGFTIESEVRAMRERMARTTFTRNEAKVIADWLGIDFETAPFTIEQFTRGMQIELEHGRRDPETDVTHDDAVMTAKIAWAHLKESPDYYERLKEFERREAGCADVDEHPWLGFEHAHVAGE